jgi:hypothetical protein
MNLLSSTHRIDFKGLQFPCMHLGDQTLRE